MAQLKPLNLWSANDATQLRGTANGQNRLTDEETGFTYRYGKVTIGGTFAGTLEPGRPVYYDSYAAGTVKTDQGGTDQIFAGILMSRVTSGNFGWFQTSGQAWAILTSALANQSNLIADPTNGRLKVVSAATDIVLAQNYAAGNLPLPLGAGGAVLGVSLKTDGSGGINAVNIVNGGTAYGNAQTYTMIFIDPTGRGSGAAGTIASSAGGVLTGTPTISAAGTNYSPQTIVLLGVTQIMLDAPLM